MEPGELEIQAMFLLCSIRKRLQGDSQVFVYMPESNSVDKQLQPETLEILRRLDIPLIIFRNTWLNDRNDLRPGDRFSNKYFALTQIPGSGYTIFLDSDMILVRDLHPEKLLNGADFMAKPVCFMNENRWDELYGLFNMEIPRHKVRASIDLKAGPPYFNGGLFCIRSSIADKLFSTWLDTFSRSDQSGIMEDNAVNREQAALAISVMQMQISYYLLTEEINFPARSKQPAPGINPYFLHYHDPECIYKVPVALQEARNFMEDYPALRELTGKMGNWNILSGPAIIPRRVKTRLKMKMKGALQLRGIK